MLALIISRIAPRPEMYVDVGLDHLEDRAAPGDVRLAIEQAALDVVEAADRVKVVLLVVVERRLLAETPEHRIGIGRDPDVVRVVIDGVLAHVLHLDTISVMNMTSIC
jgi:hypothetical protein